MPNPLVLIPEHIANTKVPVKLHENQKQRIKSKAEYGPNADQIAATNVTSAWSRTMPSVISVLNLVHTKQVKKNVLKTFLT